MPETDIPGLVPNSITICGSCGYEAIKKDYPCYRCGKIEPRLYVPLDAIIDKLTGGPPHDHEHLDIQTAEWLEKEFGGNDGTG